MKEINEILNSGILSGFRAYAEYHFGGKYVQALESEFRRYFGVKYAISFNSATAALHSALVACDIRQGDEVIVSPYSFSSSASCVLMVGGKPVFADIKEDTFCIDPCCVRKLITSKTRAIIPVHLCGLPADMDKLLFYADVYHLKIIEDAAQAICAKYKDEYIGTMGNCGVFSFNQSKHINTGEGGIMLTNDDRIAEVARAVRNHGEISAPHLKIVGYNYRMCEIEAALALSQFKNIDANIERRQILADYLTFQLRQIKGIIPPIVYPQCTHSYYTYAVRINPELGISKDKFCEELGKRGIYFGTYVKPLYLLPIYEQFGYKEGLCPVAERMWKQELIVTDIIRPSATLGDMDKIAFAFEEVLNEYSKES